MPFLILNKEDESLHTTIVFEDSDNAEGYISRNHLQNVEAINVAYAEGNYRLNKRVTSIKEKLYTRAEVDALLQQKDKLDQCLANPDVVLDSDDATPFYGDISLKERTFTEADMEKVWHSVLKYYSPRYGLNKNFSDWLKENYPQ